jgi:hypothetical protein
VFKAVLVARDEPWDAWSAPPAMSVITEDEYRRRLQASASSASPSAWDPTLVILQLRAPGGASATSAIDTHASSVAAFYSPAKRTVTIVDHGKALNAEHGTYVLAHELVHAVQDRNGALATDHGDPTVDARFARRAVVEGEAVLEANLVMMGARGQSFDKADWSSYYDTMLTSRITQLGQSTTPLDDALLLMPYPVGGPFVTDLYRRGGIPAVIDDFDHPPASTLALVSTMGAGAQDVTCRPPTPAGYSLVDSDSLGVVGTLAFLATRTGLPAWTLATDWRGDRMWLFGRADGASTALAWRLRFATAATASRVAETATAVMKVTAADSEAVIAVSEDLTLLSTWTPADCAP